MRISGQALLKHGGGVKAVLFELMEQSYVAIIYLQGAFIVKYGIEKSSFCNGCIAFPHLESDDYACTGPHGKFVHCSGLRKRFFSNKP